MSASKAAAHSGSNIRTATNSNTKTSNTREKERTGLKKGKEGWESEEAEHEQVKKDVTGWTVLTRKMHRKRTVQIFVNGYGAKVTPMEVSLTDEKVEDVMKRIQKDEDAYVTTQGRVLRRNEMLESCGVTDRCMIQVTSRMRGGPAG